MANIGVIGTPRMVSINPIMTIHVHKTTNKPLMSSIITKWYKNTNVENPKGGYRNPFVTTEGIPDHKKVIMLSQTW
jgi:hypothetical protein